MKKPTAVGMAIFRFFGRRSTTHFPNAEHRHQNKQYARAEKKRHGPTEGKRAAVYETAENEVAAHRRGKGKRKICIKPHKEGNRSADERAHDKQRRFADDKAGSRP